MLYPRTEGKQRDGHLAMDLLRRYLEQEAKTIRSNTTLTYFDLVESARLSLLDAGQIHPLTKVRAPRWKVWPDAGTALKKLQTKGYRIVALPNVDRSTFTAIRPLLEDGFQFDAIVDTPSVRGIFTQDEDPYKDTIRLCGDKFHATPKQILMVSTGGYRCIEPSTLLGTPTAWVRRDGSLEGSEQLAEILVTKPTFTVGSLEELSEVLVGNI
ncbi:hypothetical protein OE88DRAFT_1301848 [Heliocybe sulcata]|uniref:HAD-like protein n=1 Tax=Heliocybe sulcata TaxID=5364 RepID=A0A5C3N555_9AGAM|nr:hypothetical protein OE88DRAFT_1301848 [Heliocybe sulcata]